MEKKIENLEKKLAAIEKKVKRIEKIADDASMRICGGYDADWEDAEDAFDKITKICGTIKFSHR